VSIISASFLILASEAIYIRGIFISFAHRPVRQAKSQPAEQEALAEDRR
jgi:hypothetical protein